MNYSQDVVAAFDYAVDALPSSLALQVAADKYKYLTDVSLLLNHVGGVPRRFLDVGGARGANCLMLHHLGCKEIYLVDRFDLYGEEAIELTEHPAVAVLATHGVKIHRCDVTKDLLPYSDGYFDAVCAVDLIEHFSTSSLGLFSEVRRSLSGNGVFLTGCPNIAHLQNRLKLAGGGSIHPSVELWSREGFRGHVREFTRRELHWMLSQSGLTPLYTRMGEEELLSVLIERKKLQRHRTSDSMELRLSNPAQLGFYLYAALYFLVVSCLPEARYFIRTVCVRNTAVATTSNGQSTDD